MEYKVESVVLSSKEAKEFDRLYNIFSKEKGRLRIMAKGVRRPQAKLAGALEPITKSEIFLVKGRMLDKVIGAIICDQYFHIKKDLGKTSGTKRLFDLIERLMAEDEPAENFYDELIFFLEKAADADDEKMRLMELALIWKMLQEGGYQASLYHCGACGKKLAGDSGFWFIPQRGVVCSVCQGRLSGNKSVISQEAIKILRIFSQKNIRVVSKLAVSPGALRNLSAVTKIVLENMLQRKVEL